MGDTPPVRACEACGATHTGSYGSGRFCAAGCAKKAGARAKWADRAPTPPPVSVGTSPGVTAASVGRPRARCESCGAGHDETYGSGRFCSVHCARRVAAARKWAKQRGEKARRLDAIKPSMCAHAAPVPLPLTTPSAAAAAAAAYQSMIPHVVPVNPQAQSSHISPAVQSGLSQQHHQHQHHTHAMGHAHAAAAAHHALHAYVPQTAVAGKRRRTQHIVATRAAHAAVAGGAVGAAAAAAAAAAASAAVASAASLTISPSYPGIAGDAPTSTSSGIGSYSNVTSSSNLTRNLGPRGVSAIAPAGFANPMGTSPVSHQPRVVASATVANFPPNPFVDFLHPAATPIIPMPLHGQAHHALPSAHVPIFGAAPHPTPVHIHVHQPPSLGAFSGLSSLPSPSLPHPQFYYYGQVPGYPTPSTFLPLSPIHPAQASSVHHLHPQPTRGNPDSLSVGMSTGASIKTESQRRNRASGQIVSDSAKGRLAVRQKTQSDIGGEPSPPPVSAGSPAKASLSGSKTTHVSDGKEGSSSQGSKSDMSMPPADSSTSREGHVDRKEEVVSISESDIVDARLGGQRGVKPDCSQASSNPETVCMKPSVRRLKNEASSPQRQDWSRAAEALLTLRRN